ncbi:SusC/RagA family TonB-linked outer membrane protein [Arachidicoccus sp.]|uniref:SusC/RagA family TonB-linked outer membrane protein n=1 Tax=Arachidicoccus sp. TaxID=1872624 RepID=UPI003D1BBA5E
MKSFLTLLFLFICCMSMAQQIQVKGIVKEKQSQLPLAGVTVKSGDKAVFTDNTGHFEISTKAGVLLKFTYIGMNALSIKVPESGFVSIELTQNINDLNQIVVTGYTQKRKKDLIGSVSVVNVADMNKQSTANPIKGLQGRVPGVSITSDGSPSGSGTNILIRGIGTLNSTQPLYVIDGVPTTAGMHELNANDIASMQILKDASAASIYGSRAANGVIIITTKKGRSGKLSVDFNGYNSASYYANKIPMLTTGGYGQGLWQADINSGIDPNSNSVDYKFDWNLDASGNPVLNKIIVPQYLDAAKTEKASNTNWFNQITHVGLIQNYDLTLSNGNQKGDYLLSGGYFNNDGIINTTRFKRYSMRLNTDYKLFNDRVTIGENFTANKTTEGLLADPNILNTALQALPIIPVNTVSGGWGGPIGGMNDRQNPVRMLEDNKNNHYNYIRIFGNAYADIKLFKGLIFHSSYGIDYGNYNAHSFTKKYQSGYLKNDDNWLTLTQSQSTKETFTNTLNYVRDFNKHHIDVLAGTEYYHDDEQNFSTTRHGFDSESPDYTYIDAGTGTVTSTGNGSEYALFSLFGKVNYSYSDRYLASFTLRRDGSSRFGKNNRYGVFPAFSAGWRLSQEKFFKNTKALNFINDLKLRYGWGQTGNQEIDNNAQFDLYSTSYAGVNIDPTWGPSLGTAYDITGAGSGTLSSGYIQTQTGNNSIRWETSTMSNWGADFGFFNNKIVASVDYYIKQTKDILIKPPYIAVKGEGGGQWVNGASVENKGIEAVVTYNGSINKNLTFAVTGNISNYRNQVTYLPQSVLYSYGGNGLDQNILGRSLGSYYAYVADGLFRTQKELDESAAQPGKGLGRIRYKDLNGDGVIDINDQTWVGSPQPKFAYGLNISVTYKNFDFSAFIQGVYGNTIVNTQKYSTDFWSVSETGSNKGARLLQAWSPSNPNSTIPALTAIDNNNESRFSTYFLEKGSYTKLRNLQIGYTLPKKILKKMKLNKFRIYIGGDNLWIITKSKTFTGIDPETPGYGYPNPRVFTGGIDISL